MKFHKEVAHHFVFGKKRVQTKHPLAMVKMFSGERPYNYLDRFYPNEPHVHSFEMVNGKEYATAAHHVLGEGSEARVKLNDDLASFVLTLKDMPHLIFKMGRFRLFKDDSFFPRLQFLAEQEGVHLGPQILNFYNNAILWSTCLTKLLNNQDEPISEIEASAIAANLYAQDPFDDFMEDLQAHSAARGQVIDFRQFRIKEQLEHYWELDRPRP